VALDAQAHLARYPVWDCQPRAPVVALAVAAVEDLMLGRGESSPDPAMPRAQTGEGTPPVPP
jgi:hypothetical protein